MKKFCFLFLIVSILWVFCPTLSLAQTGDIEYRPSYQNIYLPCSANKEDYKFKVYSDIYRASLYNVLSLSLSSEAITTNINLRGITPQLDEFLQSDTTSPALRRCFGSADEEFAFIRNLLIVDSVGKVVGISATVVGVRYLGLVLKKLLAPLAEFSPRLYKFAMGATIGGNAAYSAWSYYHSSKGSSEKQAPDQAEALKNNIRQNMRIMATTAIQQIDVLLSNPQTDAKTREQLQVKRGQWLLVLKSYA